MDDRLHVLYVINMDRSRKRWRQWKSEARVNVRRVRAIDGRRDLRASDMNYFRSADFENRAARGCALSHLKAMRQSLENDDPFAIICEDDVLLSDCVSARIQLLTTSLPENWELVFFANVKNRSVSFPFSKARAPSVWNFSGCSMYMISRAAMQRYVEAKDEVGFHRAVDWDLIDFFPQHFLHPHGAYALDGTTTIQARRSQQHWKYVLPIIGCIVITAYLLGKCR